MGKANSERMKEIAFCEVSHLHDSLFANSVSVSYAQRILKAANEHAKGAWLVGQLTRGEIESIILSYHQSEGGGIMLSPRSGMQLKDAIQLVQRNALYPQSSPGCWNKIKPHMESNFSPIFLAKHPVKNWEDHQQLQAGRDYFHLDGLHRLVGWGLGNRFNQFSEDEQVSGLEVYIAANV